MFESRESIRKIWLPSFEKLTIKQLATLIYAGLIHEDKQLNVEKVIDLIDEHSDLQEISDKLGKAIEIGFGHNKEKDKLGK